MHRNLHHHFQSFYRILACSRLSGKHDRTGSLINGVRNVCRLRTGRTRMDHHGVEHLCCSDNNLSCRIYLLNNLLLDDRHMFQRNFHTHVSSGDHDSVCRLDDRINVIHALLIFNLGNDMDFISAVIIEELSHLADVFSRPCK